MIDPETRAVLQATLEHLKTQTIYVRNLHDAFSALYDGVTQMHSDLKPLVEEEMKKIRPNPVQQSQIEQLDVLLGELSKYHS